MKQFFALVLSFTLVFSCSARAAEQEQAAPTALANSEKNQLLIGLAGRVDQAPVACVGETDKNEEKKFTVAEINARDSASFDDAETLKIEDGRLRCGKKTFALPVQVFPQEGGVLVWRSRRYRGSLVLRNIGGQLSAINQLPLDDYLRGVLPKEVGREWPIESLKAQAVISRTYALKSLDKHNGQGYDLCDGVHCQVYGGMESEWPTTNQAVEETSGQVLLYEGELASTFFFGTCGGRTEAPLNTWNYGKETPYLKSVRCKYCRDSKHFSWEAFFTQTEIKNALSKIENIQLPIHSVKVHDTGISGRATAFKVRHSGGSVVVKANAFRLALGSDKMDSTLVRSISKTRDGFLFKGNGWGHGVGLCQDGARGMALDEHNYKEILEFYYPGTELISNL